MSENASAQSCQVVQSPFPRPPAPPGLSAEFRPDTSGNTADVECLICGAGNRIPGRFTGYRCAVCCAEVVFRCCAHCRNVSPIYVAEAELDQGCTYCGKVEKLDRWDANPVTAGSLSGTDRCMVPYSMPSPHTRLIAGLAVARSGLPKLKANHPCVLRCGPDYVGVLTEFQSESVETYAIDYQSINHLEIYGHGLQVSTTDAGMIGGGFGMQGAVVGVLMSEFVNWSTSSTSRNMDTVVEFRAGTAALLLKTFHFDPAPLRTLLAPVFQRIELARSAVSNTGHHSETELP